MSRFEYCRDAKIKYKLDKLKSAFPGDIVILKDNRAGIFLNKTSDSHVLVSIISNEKSEVIDLNEQVLIVKDINLKN